MLCQPLIPLLPPVASDSGNQCYLKAKIFTLGEWYSCRRLAVVENSGVLPLGFKFIMLCTWNLISARGIVYTVNIPKALKHVTEDLHTDFVPDLRLVL